MTTANTVLDTFNWRLLWLRINAEKGLQSAHTLEALEALVEGITNDVARLRWEYVQLSISCP